MIFVLPFAFEEHLFLVTISYFVFEVDVFLRSSLGAPERHTKHTVIIKKTSKQLHDTVIG